MKPLFLFPWSVREHTGRLITSQGRETRRTWLLHLLRMPDCGIHCVTAHTAACLPCGEVPPATSDWSPSLNCSHERNRPTGHFRCVYSCQVHSSVE